jgi:flagellar protein FlaI
LIEVLDVNLMKIDSQESARNFLREKAEDVLNHYGFKISNEDKEKLLYYVIRDNMGYGKIDAIMHDPGIEDISCDGVGINVYVWHRKYEYVPTSIRFENSEELNSFALRLAYLCRSHVSIAQPILDSSLPDGSRIHMTFGTEITRRGSTFAIRKFRTDPMTIIDLIDYGTISSELAAYFWYAVENRVSIMVSGGIAAGKTTMLNCLSMFIKPDMKIVTIEDTPEMNLPHQNWIPTTTRTHFGIGTEASDITLFDLLKASLRQRPDYIIVGEIRGDEAYTLFQAVGTGHLGMSTLHAESVEAAIYRLESEPMNVPRTLISGINIITVQKRVDYKDKPCRRTVSASEIIGLDPRSREILTNDVYRWNPTNDLFDFSGRSYLIERIAQKKGISIEAAYEEIKRRTQILEGLSKRNIRNYLEVSDVIRRYYENPKSFLISEVMKGE